MFKYLLVILCITYVFPVDVSIGILGKNLLVKENTGEITLSTSYLNTTNSSNVFFVNGSITINFASIIEKDSQGNEVGKNSTVKHSFNNFNFTLSPENITNVQNVAAKNYILTATNPIDKKTIFQVDLYFFTDSGKIKLGDTSIVDVTPAALKISLLVNNWPFCSQNCTDPTCCVNGLTNEVGSYLDFQMQLKGLNDSKRINDYYDVGNGEFDPDSIVYKDSDNSKYTIGYPTLGNQGTKDVFTFRFPTFNRSIMYDSFLIINDYNDDGVSILLIIIIVLAVLVIVGLAVFFFIKRKNNNKSNLML
jgi:hypothetical protein